MPRDAEIESKMPESRQDVRALRKRVRRHTYKVDERAVASAMLARPMMRLFLAPARDRRTAA